MNNGINPIFSLGPLRDPWNSSQIRQLYHDAASNPLIKRVYIGEIVCAKRSPMIAKHLPEIIDILDQADKQIIFSTPILLNNEESQQLMHTNIELARKYQTPIEINDLAGLKYVADLELIIGPYINTYNQSSLAVFARNGAKLVCPPFELSSEVIADLAVFGLPLEVNVFGRLPLSISSRCFTARNLDLQRDECKLACFKHIAGFNVLSDNQELFNLNGMQVQSAKICNLIKGIPDLITIGVNHFRITPTSGFSLTQISELIEAQLNAMTSSTTLVSDKNLFANGFYYNQEGYRFIE